ncbi:uncharacterized protein LOC118762220 [Octopus sinensis]|uniref:Uncharacterized protein LOC118762220 n=1 Tax=Octopus sinensis TaxID=2607531 RepID=A0A7E6EMU3_9MOLL|nr:uncharacterized protein LOC118762220 [Octopus sinensis]
MIFSFQQVREKVHEENQELFMTFIDLTKAFNTVNWQALWKVLEKLGVPDKMLNVIISFHERMKAAVMSGGGSSASFNITNGTKQGCVLASVLFALFSVMLSYAFDNIQSGVKFQFRTSGDYSIISVSNSFLQFDKLDGDEQLQIAKVASSRTANSTTGYSIRKFIMSSSFGLQT